MNKENLYTQQRQPLLIVISGPSGVGKDTIAQLILERYDDFYFVVTATTRPPRVGEVHGKDYFFVSHDEFHRMIEEDELLEHAVVYNDYKGVPKQQIREAFASGKDVIMRLDPQGAATMKKLVEGAVFIFIVAESEEALVNRLKERQSESPEGLKLRIETATQEMLRMQEFDYCVVNADGERDRAVDDILAIIRAAHCRVKQEMILI